ncbi:META domain-containing protein [Microvirga pudoricolor]|uniref:META domain-containing protein n=1 Tax=Microvirga pudoricolor TaxID=2778729 RepID=UPI00195227D9|nr:META domain-containing protein [Microvirga pudoricolor]MBM6592738.1 META domain-containing protein [Microvirga pudoricolor]
MNALRPVAHMSVRLFAMLLAALAFVPAAHAQSAASAGRPAGPSRQVDPKVPQPGQGGKVFPLNSSWLAVSLNGRAFGGSERPSFSLDGQLRARGFGGCNTFAATAYPLREQGLAVGPLALTKRSCDRNVMASEQAFFVALRTSAKWDIQGSTLIIKSQNGELRFERAL